MDRRKFIEMSVAAGTAVMLRPSEVFAKDNSRRKSVPAWASPGLAADRESYSIVILGDTHYDASSPDVYHSDYNEPTEWLNRVQRAEFDRNGRMWSTRCPKMLERAARLVSDDTALVMQTGDLIQGDCGNPAVHRKMLDDVMNYFKSSFGSLPFVTVCGNHDIRGTGAQDAYAQYMPARMSAELGIPVTGTTFHFNVGPDAFVVIDFNNPREEEILRELEATAGARYTFVFIHGPLMPYDGGSCRWFLYGNKKHTELRRRLRKEFAGRNVICLCGHTHRIELADWFGDGGRITQFTMNSVWSADELAQLTVDARGAAQYGILRNNQILDNGDKPKDETALFDEYRDGLKRYLHAAGAGSFKLNVSPYGITVDFYGGASETVSETFVLR